MIITDGSCDFRKEFFEENNIKIVPMFIYFGDDEYLSTEIDMDEFYKRLDKEYPRTSQPSPKMFLEAIQNVENPIIVTISSKLSGTYNSAKMAAGLVENVKVIDSLQASTGLALKIMNILEGVDRKIEIFGMPESLDLLIRNGRIGKVKGFIAQKLGILPLIELKDGELVPISKSRGNQVNTIYEELMKRSPETDVVYISHSRSENVNELDDKISENYKTEVIEVGPVITSHLGKGSLFVSYRVIE